MTFILFLKVRTWKNIKFTMEEENYRFLTLYWNGILERSLYSYIGNLRILTNTYATAATTKQVARKVLFPPCLIEHIPLSEIKMTYTKKARERIKQVLKENGYQESIISKIFKRITNNHNLHQSQQQTQATDILEEEIRMSINLPYVQGTCEKLRRILKFHKMRSTFYTENNLRKLLCKPKDWDWVATEDKSNIVYETGCSNCESVYFGESKCSLKSRSLEHKISVRNCHCDKNEITKQCWEADHNFSWDQIKVVDRESRLLPRKIKETMHSLKNPNHIEKISYMFPETWLPNLW